MDTYLHSLLKSRRLLYCPKLRTQKKTNALCFIIRASLALKSVSQFSLLSFSSLMWRISHNGHTNKLSVGFFYWLTYKVTAFHKREATRNAFCVPDCYKKCKFCQSHNYLLVSMHPLRRNYILFIQVETMKINKTRKQKYFFLSVCKKIV